MVVDTEDNIIGYDIFTDIKFDKRDCIGPTKC